ncbi:MAG: hypothetical protein ACXVCR_07425 [Bdellovibrio sp.]
MAANKNLNRLLTKTHKENLKLGYTDGGNFVRHVYETSFVKIFGRKLGLIISDYVLKEGIKEVTKK